jgi:hypothetical protein
MNSMSKSHCCGEHERKHERELECKCVERRKLKRRCNTTIVKCGCPSAITIPAATAAGTTFVVSSLALNTEGLHDPCVKLEFASNLVATAFTGTINFQVLKLCRGQFTPIPIGPVWTFTGAALTGAETFTFFVCDCDSCFDECCNYTVTATVIGAATAGTLAINNATLGAIAASEVEEEEEDDDDDRRRR